ncbi:MAG: hypothetical protein AAF530_12330 [Pseudomonadota bacterium]
MTGLIFTVFVILALAVFCAATANRVVATLNYTGGGIVLRLGLIWLVAIVLHLLISMVPPMLTYDGLCEGVPDGSWDCGPIDFLAYNLAISIAFSLLFFGLYFLAILVGAVTGLIARHRKLSPKTSH